MRARKVYKELILVLPVFSLLFGFCFSNDYKAENSMRDSIKTNIDSCQIAKKFEGIEFINLFAKTNFTGEIKNYFGTDTTKLDFRHLFANGKVTKSYFYFENGYIQSENSYKCDALHGTQRYYYDNGKIAQLLPYSYGYKDGTGELFDKSGILRQQVVFISDSMVGKPKMFDETGKVLD